MTIQEQFSYPVEHTPEIVSELYKSLFKQDIQLHENTVTQIGNPKTVVSRMLDWVESEGGKIYYCDLKKLDKLSIPDLLRKTYVYIDFYNELRKYHKMDKYCTEMINQCQLFIDRLKWNNL